MALSNAGSSPLTRGKRHFQALNNLVLRLIPAHAGKTGRGTAADPCRAAHPRSRGENGVVSPPLPVFDGSSPLTRGKQLAPVTSVIGGGLIPAHAGKTRTIRVAQVSAAAHPRSRGENGEEPEGPKVTVGSSPLTRGKPLGDHHLHTSARLIPAHAGKTVGVGIRGPRFGAHPRSRGENSVDGGFNWLANGSSPLTRGKRPHGHDLQPRRRLIPAHAGKTRA